MGRGWRLRFRLSGEVEVKVKQGTSNPLYSQPEPQHEPSLRLEVMRLKAESGKLAPVLGSC